MERRGFLKLAAMAGLGVVADPRDLFAQYRVLAPVRAQNPLGACRRKVVGSARATG